MASRLKEDEKNEKIIRGLLKLPDNRRCINCNSLGPQYVCTNFWTFVCTNCSGIHREFTHRVKSVSMAKFTSQEVNALQEGGNKRAKEIYLKEWDSQRQSLPDSSNVGRLRDFIKHVYVDRRYSGGERNYEKPPRGKMGEKDDLFEHRRTDTFQGGSRSPPYEDGYDRRYSDMSSPGGRSDDRNSKYGYDERRSPGYDKKSPSRPEIINDWRREDRFGNGRKFEERRTSEGDVKLEGRSPERVKDVGTSSPPIARPVREILGENVVPLRIGEPPKANGSRVSDGPSHPQRTASSSSLGSTNGNPVEVKVENPKSLIDFDAEPEPPRPAASPQVPQTATAQSVSQTVSSAGDNNWASFDSVPQAQVSHTPSKPNTLESLLSELSVPASVPGPTSAMPGGVAPTGVPFGSTMVRPVMVDTSAAFGQPSVLPSSSGASPTGPVTNFPTFPPSGTLQTQTTDAGQWPGNQTQQPYLFPAAGNQQNSPPFVGVPTSQPSNLSFSQNTQGPFSTPAVQSVSKAPHEPSVGVSPQPAEAKSSGRQALPEDLFATTYLPFPGGVPGWYTGPPRGMPYPMQYNIAMHMPQPMPMQQVMPMQLTVPTFPQTSKSTNPFDFNNEPPQTFPSMASLQGALPNAQPSPGLLRSSSLGTPSPSPLMPNQSATYSSAMPPQGASYGQSMAPRPYMGQQIPNSMLPSGLQGPGNFGSEAGPFGSINTHQQLPGRFSAPATPQPFSSVGGNPFG